MSAPRLGVNVLVDNWGSVVYEKPELGYRESESSLVLPDTYEQDAPRVVHKPVYATERRM
jgi:hypothetical protein